MRSIFIPALVIVVLLGLAALPSSATPAFQSGYRAQVGAYLPLVFKALPPPTATATFGPAPTVTRIPTSTLVPSNTPVPTNTPAPSNTPMKPARLDLLSSHGLFASSSFYYVVGELLNTGDYFAYDARVTARFYDTNNKLIAVEHGSGLLSRIDPGLRIPFRILLSNAPATIDHYELSVDFASSTLLDYRRIAIASREVRDNYGIEVFGEVRNEQPLKINNIKVAVTFYDNSGKVVYVDEQYQGFGLAPGGVRAYKVSTLRAVAFASYLVQSEGYRE